MKKRALLTCLITFLFISNQTSSPAREKQVTNSQQRLAARRHEQLVKRGKAIFSAYQCLDCHKLQGKGCIDGITLDGVGDLRSSSFLREQLEDPEKHLAKVRPGESSMMTAPNMNKAEVQAVVAYLKTFKTPAKTKGTKKQQ